MEVREKCYTDMKSCDFRFGVPIRESAKKVFSGKALSKGNFFNKGMSNADSGGKRK